MIMHILFFTHYFPPEVNAPASRTYEHAIRWIKKGMKVTVITNQPNHPHGKIFSGYKNDWLSKESIDGINVIRVKTYLTPNKGTAKRIMNFLVYMILAVWHSLKVKNTDVILATSPQFFCGFAGTIASKLNRKPFILEIRDLWPDSILAVGALKENFAIKFLRVLEKQMYFSATKIVTLTDAFKKYISDLGYDDNNIVTIPNSMDLSRIKSISKPKTDFKKQDRFICSYIGTFGMAHNLGVVVETAKILKDNETIHFLLIGDGAEKETIVEQARGLSNITILPLQTKKDIPWFYNISDVGLIMLKNNKLFTTVIPSKIFEYMVMKKPMIMSMPEGEATKIVIGNNCGIYCEPDNAKELAQRIQEIYNDKSYLKDLGEKGYDLAINKYNRNEMADKMIQVMKKTCS